MHLRKILMFQVKWDDILITTMFKKKGSWKKLDNYRGIFIVTILQLIYEKVLKKQNIRYTSEKYVKVSEW